MNIALIFAGGTGQRMNSGTRPKQFLELHGKPIIIYTIEHFENHPEIDGIAVVCLESWSPYFRRQLQKFGVEKVKWIVPGGATGQGSIRNGLTALWEDGSVPRDATVLIHDGVRPLINEKVITDNIDSVRRFGNGITVTPAIETVISINGGGEVDKIYDRSVCRLARAPQSFRLCDIVEAHRKAAADGKENMIDSAMLMSHYGATLHIVDGPAENIKITTPSDYYTFRAMYEARENTQILGF